MMKKYIVSTLLALSFFSGIAKAERPQRPPQPPLEAFQACEDKQENEATTIKTPYGEEIAATCKVVKHPDEGKLVAVPNEKPQQPREPQEQ